ncbi:MAG TPA: indolepyruvate ferredoxin oxidoreductase family protein [Pseudonocardia sp.]
MAAPTTRSLLDDRYELEVGVIHLTGIHALARLPLDVRRADQRAGRRTAVFISGYEGSPLGGYDLELNRHRELLDAHDVVFRPAVNEELAATAVQGTQVAAGSPDRRVDGVTGFWYGKSPGLDRATDALRHANLAGTHHLGGAVAFVGDDPGAKSSTVPGASEQLLADLGMPTLYPADPQQVLDLGRHAVALSRASGLWVGFKVVTNVADGAATVQVHPERVVPVLPELEVDGRPFVHEVTTRLMQPALTPLERSRNGVRLELARRYAALNGLNRIVRSGPADRIGIVAPGKTFLDLRQALHILGLDDAELERRGVRLLQLGMVHPLEPTIVTEFARGLREIVVVEEKRSFVETAIKDLFYGHADAPAVIGKYASAGVPLLPSEGELDADTVAAALAERFDEHGNFPTVTAWRAAQQPARNVIELPVIPRTPYFCSGCPHNSSTKVPEGSLVGAGIGCHAMVLLMPPERVGDIAGLTQMGGEGAQWIGMAPFLTRTHLLQNIGDGTFHHSGSLAVRAAIAAGVNITYKLLYNSAVAMTGGQQAVGVMSVTEITRALAAEGVRKMIITTERPEDYRRTGLPAGVEVWHRDRLLEAQEALARVEGVTVLVHDQECATELRRKRKRGLAPDPAERVMINERVCEGCGDCGVASNCLSVQPVRTEFGRKTRIDQSSCNKDYSCLDGDCPSFLTIVPPPGGRTSTTAPDLDAGTLPAPRLVVPADRHTTRILGVGGSGVVTTSQILGVAATIAGRQVSSLDQTGMAQKGGAVVGDIKISDEAVDGASKAASGEVDLYLAADLLVAADPKNLAAASPSRTVAVVSTAQVPTGPMVTDTALPFPEIADVNDRIRRATRGAEAVFLDARGLAETLFGDDQFATMLLVGAALQAGALPLPAEAVEEAIGLNGVRTRQNVQAFRRGRQFVADPAAFEATVAELRGESRAPAPTSARARELISSVAAPDGSELARLLEIRVPDLIDYQNAGYAAAYTSFIARTLDAENRRVPGSTALTEAVARQLYKLMAYKDEYEVARLSLDPAVDAAVAARFGAGAKKSYRLHPPVLRTMGMRKKITLGPWFTPVFRLLVALRRVRGTPLDVFGRAAVRRVERELIVEYRHAVERLLDVVEPDSLPLAVEIANLPDEVRGYEHVKLRNVARYRERLGSLQEQLQGQSADRDGRSGGIRLRSPN